MLSLPSPLEPNSSVWKQEPEFLVSKTEDMVWLSAAGLYLRIVAGKIRP